MARNKTVFICESCGASHAKWAGQCSDCGAWNTLVESVAAAPAKPGASAPTNFGNAAPQVERLNAIRPAETARTPTGLSELDRVLGGGLVPGSVILIGGDPGIGKSTLLLQVLAQLSAAIPALYVTGEESLEQVHLRAQRLGVDQAELAVLAETCVERVLALAKPQAPRLVVIDSVQTVFSQAVTSAPGSVSQVRESASMLVRFAKATGTALILVGHVTKEGTIAGPRVLEHMVDTVLYFEAEASSRFRVIRAVKNRFGAVNELGVFAMSSAGLKQVTNPSAIFLSRHETAVPGSAVMVTREGSRPMLVEVQALVDESQLHNPRRVALGPDSQRLAMLLAVLHRHGGIPLGDQDVFVNVVGGMRVTETAADLAVVLAALSSFRDRALGERLVIFGEIGLAGEIRPVPGGEERLSEAAKHGFTRAIVPKANMPRSKRVGDMEVVGVARLSEAIDAIS
ncbi:DNA repair protein radA [Salinisphaera shabanensis E1L3A]|uniref:DNA repair protein radA n=1 Tax=Salinisphaera shabanensis E1L3A TaxID=1033802 RepID=A0ACB4V5L7_9GAMM|nr:DNA repair protein RadA [Salinisphaera shabanensis]ERJ18969.1 DNA repair protein radA [Salinisphaera shabanensis E1L3A]